MIVAKENYFEPMTYLKAYCPAKLSIVDAYDSVQFLSTHRDGQKQQLCFHAIRHSINQTPFHTRAALPSAHQLGFHAGKICRYFYRT